MELYQLQIERDVGSDTGFPVGLGLDSTGNMLERVKAKSLAKIQG